MKSAAGDLRRPTKSAQSQTLHCCNIGDYPEIAEEAFAAGADGYVIKIDATPELHAALEAAMFGKRYASKSLARVM